jgi:hypothetical protein
MRVEVSDSVTVSAVECKEMNVWGYDGERPSAVRGQKETGHDSSSG